MPKPKRITYCLVAILFASCGIFRSFEKDLGDSLRIGFGVIFSNLSVLIAFCDDSISAIYQENSLEADNPIYIHSLNASLVGKRWSPFDITLKGIEITTGTVVFSKPFGSDSLLMAVYHDGRTYPYHLLYLSSDTLDISVTCEYSYENNADSINRITSYYILNGDIFNGGNLLHLNPNGSRDTLLPSKKEQQPIANQKNDFSVEYKLNKKGKWEITKTPLQTI